MEIHEKMIPVSVPSKPTYFLSQIATIENVDDQVKKKKNSNALNDT
ncbi:hypothetical protein BML2537_24610 [Providencia stuartii]|nr:hypothetical protein BML2537_24610 [Providencia stuartii]GHB85190.1 hypothetical protein GCM10007290_07430 [Providencia thailandensis]